MRCSVLNTVHVTLKWAVRIVDNDQRYWWFHVFLDRFFWATRFLFLFFPYFFVFVPCARLSWPSRQLLSAFERTLIHRIVSYRIPPPEHRRGRGPPWHMDTNSASEPETSRPIEKPQFYLPTRIWRPSWGWSHRNFVQIFCVIKLLCGIVFLILYFAILIQHQLVTDGRTDTGL